MSKTFTKILTFPILDYKVSYKFLKPWLWNWQKIIKKFNMRFFVSIIAVAVLIFSAYTWYQAERVADRIYANDFWYIEPTLSRMERDFTYEQAFRETVLVDFLIFASVILILKIVPEKK